MSHDPVVIPFRRATTPGIGVGGNIGRQGRIEPVVRRPVRYVTQSHPVSAPMANPKALVIALAVAVGLYLLGRRLSS